MKYDIVWINKGYPHKSGIIKENLSQDEALSLINLYHEQPEWKEFILYVVSQLN